MISKTRSFLIKCTYIAIDVCLLGLIIWGVCWMRQGTLSFPVTFFNVFFESNNPFRFIFLFWVFAMVFLNNSHGLYQTKREVFETIEIVNVLKAVVLASFFVIIAAFIVRVENFPRLIVFFVTIFSIVMLSLWRVCKRIFVEYLVAHGYNNFNVLIIGSGKIGRALAQEVRKKPELGLNIIGYLDDGDDQLFGDTDKRVLGGVSDFPVIARREFIEKVFITTHENSGVFLKILEQAKELGIAVRVIPHGFELMSGDFVKYNIGFIPVLEYCDAVPLRKQFGKRLLDLFVTSFAVILLFPVFLMVAILIKSDSKGAAIYISKRYGRSGRVFKMYKFRSMRVDADKMIDQIQNQNEADGPIFKIKNDPRITNIGRFLRKYSLDELPQLFNVIRGDMSLVGPRPLPLDQVKREDLRQLMRLKVRPGITGLWQIRGRSDVSFARLVKWDMWYINNWSFWLDLNILFQTIPVVFKARGAY